MDITTGQDFTDLIAMHIDYGRRVRDGGGHYWSCRCSCGKIVSVRDKDLISKKIISCKLAGKPCKTNRNIAVVIGDRYFGFVVIKSNLGPLPDGSRKKYYCIKCASCGAESVKRGDTILSNTFARPCDCVFSQSTEKSKD